MLTRCQKPTQLTVHADHSSIKDLLPIELENHCVGKLMQQLGLRYCVTKELKSNLTLRFLRFHSRLKPNMTTGHSPIGVTANDKDRIRGESELAQKKQNS